MHALFLLLVLLHFVDTSTNSFFGVPQSPSTSLSWWEAESLCQTSSFHHLAIIQRQSDHIKTSQLCNQTSSRKCWIGLSDLRKEGHFEWNDQFQTNTSQFRILDANAQIFSNKGDCVKLDCTYVNHNYCLWTDHSCLSTDPTVPLCINSSSFAPLSPS